MSTEVNTGLGCGAPPVHTTNFPFALLLYMTVLSLSLHSPTLDPLLIFKEINNRSVNSQQHHLYRLAPHRRLRWALFNPKSPRLQATMGKGNPCTRDNPVSTCGLAHLQIFFGKSPRPQIPFCSRGQNKPTLLPSPSDWWLFIFPLHIHNKTQLTN